VGETLVHTFAKKDIAHSVVSATSTRRKFNLALAKKAVVAAGGLLTLPSATKAQSGPITIAVPTLTGGLNDQLARALAFGLTPELKRPVLVENILGDVGLRALLAAEDSAPENPTVLIANDVFTNLYPATLKKHAASPITRLTPVSVLSDYAFALVVSADSKIDSLSSYLSAVNDNPSKAIYAVSANGTYTHFYASLLGIAAKTKLQSTVLRTTKAVLDSIVKSDTAASVMDVGSLLEYQKAGKIKFLAVSSDKRLAQFASIPTFTELGYPDLLLQGFHGLYASPKANPEFLAEMRSAVRKAVQTPLVLDLFTQFGLAAAASMESSEESRMRVNSQARRWLAHVRASGYEAI
jgi:tripartite-type tricarboxylate transporter receptor subunit TctC